jgi:sulfatase modifying factor 1
VRAVARRGLAGLGVLMLGVACENAPPKGGVLLVMNIDATLRTSDLSELQVDVDAPSGGGPPYYQGTFAIPGSLPAFPVSVAIDSNGNATASATVHLSLRDHSTEVDVRTYEIVNIPVQSVTQLDVTFSRECSPGVASCGAGRTCCPTGGGTGWGCSTDLVNAENGGQPVLACQGADAGAPEATPDAGSDGAAGPLASDASGPSDASLDSTVDAGDASDEDAVADGPPVGYDGATSCSIACVEGQTHCVGGACVAVPPSCAGGGAGVGFNCGGPFGSQDCCAMLDVPLTAQGSFYRDYDMTENPEVESNPATVSQFSLDVFEVTVGRYRKFVNAVSGTDASPAWVPPAGSGMHTYLPGGGLNSGGDGGLTYETGWDASWDSELPATKPGWDTALFEPCQADGRADFTTWTPDPGDNENKPITCLDWYEAYAFCIWDGGFLPSATEWDFAASGGAQQWAYAWGNDPPGANIDRAIYQCYYGNLQGTPTGDCLGSRNVAPVGTVPAGQGFWGQLDLTGNALEWTFDLYAATYQSPCVDCADLSAGDQRILRGGGYDSVPLQLHNYYRSLSPPEQSDVEAGVRCARAPY